MKKLLVAALFVVLATPAFAAIQNVKVSGGITSSFVHRNDFTLGTPTGDLYLDGLKKQNVFLTQTQVRIDADLSDNVSATVALLNERAWNNGSGAATPTDQGVDIYLANVTLRELLYSPLTVTVGRQIFTYGNGLVLGNGPANQTNGGLQLIDQDLGWSTAEDGIKATLDYKPLTIDLIYFKNDQKNLTGVIQNGGASSANQSSEVFGYNANYQLSDPWNTVIEQYVFSRVDEAGYTGNNKSDKLYVPGLRVSTNPVKGLNIQGEIAWQLGDKVVALGTAPTTAQQAESRDAMAIQALASYSLPVMEKYKPTINASYTYLSGDKMSATNGTTGNKDARHYSAWDVFMGDIGAGTIYSAIYPLTNMNILSAGASVSPLEDVTTSFTWSNLWAADSYNATNNPLQIYQPSEGIELNTLNTKNNGARGLGNEYDVNLNYNYTEDVTFGVSLGWYVPGSALSNTNRDTASQAIASLGVKF